MDKEKTMEEYMNILKMQDEILQVTHFTNDDAWELGKLMAEEAKGRNLHIAISIRLNSGLVLFQYIMDGATLDNVSWMERKFNTVRSQEVSSLEFYMYLKNSGHTMADKFLDENVYACSGGGFPIRIEEVGVIGAILVSGMNHVQDHDFIIKCLSKYLHMDEVPRLKQI